MDSFQKGLLILIIIASRFSQVMVQLYSAGSSGIDYDNEMGFYDTLPFQDKQHQVSNTDSGKHVLELPLYFLAPDPMVNSDKNMPPVKVVAQNSVPGYSMVRLDNIGLSNINDIGQKRAGTESYYNNFLNILQQPHFSDSSKTNKQDGVFNNIDLELFLDQNRHGKESSLTNSYEMQGRYLTPQEQSIGSFAATNLASLYPSNSDNILKFPSSSSVHKYGTVQANPITHLLTDSAESQSTGKSLPGYMSQPIIAFDILSSSAQHPGQVTQRSPYHHGMNHYSHSPQHEATYTYPSQHSNLQSFNNPTQNHYPQQHQQQQSSVYPQPHKTPISQNTHMHNLLGTLINMLKKQQAPPQRFIHHVPVPYLPPLPRPPRRRRPVLSSFYGKTGSRRSSRYRNRRKRGRSPMYKRLLRAYGRRGESGDKDKNSDDDDEDGESTMSVFGESVSDNDDVFDIEIRDDDDSDYSMLDGMEDDDYTDFENEY